VAKAPLKTVRNSKLFTVYKRLLLGEDIGSAESEALLKAAVIFLNNENSDLNSLGYRIVVMYSNLKNDYVPLYDVALSKGLMPIVRSIESQLPLDGEAAGFFPEFFSSLAEMYRVGNAIYTEQQLDLSSFFSEKKLYDITITAPTSYGKSELISNFCKESMDSSICVIVPTKALLAQTKQRLLNKKNEDDVRQIITHQEMYQGGDQKIIAILTQERLLRLFVKHPDFLFDFIFVDEAHNLLGNDQRALLLASVIILQKKKNPNSRIKYLTPFLVDQKNLHLRYHGFETEEYKVNENIKTERFYLVDFRDDGNLLQYDQFFDELVSCNVDSQNNVFEFIHKYAAPKNIIFFNSPKKIEKFLREFLPTSPLVEDEDVDRAIASISEFVHEEYLLVEGLRRGILYHHGSVPDIVKLYIERLYSKIRDVQHIVCSSTLLEGVNIPAERLFLLEYKKGPRKLSKSQFRNLVGRICRFNEIFDQTNGKLSMLEPEIFVIGTPDYLGTNANIKKFIKEVAQVDLTIKDSIENLLLDDVEINEEIQEEAKIEADIFLENILPGTTGSEVKHADTEVGKLCFLNNISEINILDFEKQIEDALDAFEGLAQTTNEVLSLLATAFIPYLKGGTSFYILKRLEKPEAQSFYSMLLDWRINGTPYSEMIKNFLRYWEGIDDDLVYVGKWGDVQLDEAYITHWVEIKEKSYSERVNLAIVRIKEEQDFIDNYIMKFVETLNDLNKLDKDLYLNIKYGTTDQNKIALINGGINSYLASKLIATYSDCVEFNAQTGIAELRPQLIEKMRNNGENDILVFEAELQIGFTD